MAEALIRRHLVVRGLVQGVAFRYAAHRKAGELGLAGWIRNRRDGTVEAVVQGEPTAVETMVSWCRHGPPAARVSEVRVDEEPPDPSLATFQVLPTT